MEDKNQQPYLHHRNRVPGDGGSSSHFPIHEQQLKLSHNDKFRIVIVNANQKHRKQQQSPLAIIIKIPGPRRAVMNSNTGTNSKQTNMISILIFPQK